MGGISRVEATLAVSLIGTVSYRLGPPAPGSAIYSEYYQESVYGNKRLSAFRGKYIFPQQ